jgi:coiled-coil domain-containing protein 22
VTGVPKNDLFCFCFLHPSDLDESLESLAQISPEKLVETVSRCVHLIKPDLPDVPATLPSNMAQRFATATTLAETCVALGFRGDIGYQTFLYQNVTEVRRLFMFLIERLPKESEKTSTISHQPLDKVSEIENEIHENIRQQLATPWIPEYCRLVNVRGTGNECSDAVPRKAFKPKKLKVPFVTQKDVTDEIKEYWSRNTPSIFQQTVSSTLIPSVIHTNSRCNVAASVSANRISKSALETQSALSSPEHLAKSLSDMNLKRPAATESGPKVVNPLATINAEIEQLKDQLETAASSHGTMQEFQQQQSEQETRECGALKELKDAKRVKERIKLLLENPEENMKKLESIMMTTRERMKRLEGQWDEHRKPLVETLEKATEKNSSKFSKSRLVQDQINATKAKSNEVIADVRQKFQIHQQLTEELEKLDTNMSRNAYTSRILEIIGNITKQNRDIDRVLQDTRVLQKDINTISGQLGRQFTVTDDLIYKTAKRDEYSKKAYKLLATLHADCDELVRLVQETGTTLRDVRDLEDQIEQERGRNVLANLERITSDLVEMQRDSGVLLERLDELERSSRTIGADEETYEEDS